MKSAALVPMTSSPPSRKALPIRPSCQSYCREMLNFLEDSVHGHKKEAA